MIYVILLVCFFVIGIYLSFAIENSDKKKEAAEKEKQRKQEVEALNAQIERLKKRCKDKQDECVDLLEKKTRLEEELDDIYDKTLKAEEHYQTLINKTYQTALKKSSITPPTVQAANAIVGMDFEYLITGRQDTPCQVGLVLIVDDVIVLRYSSLIYVPESIEGTLSYGNGITREMVKNAPSFADVVKVMESICEGATIVAHNKSTEMSVIKKACELYQIESWLTTAAMEDTCKLMGGKGLQECCELHNIELKHHDALSDAEASARLYLISKGKKAKEESVRVFGKSSTVDTSHGDVYKPLSDDQVENKNTPFFGGVKTVVTGTFDNFPDRAVLKEKLKLLGADVDTSVTKKTQIVVVGHGCGPKKMEKVEEYGIRIMKEDEVMKYIQ